jgi:class 3 adenylate cyclase
MELAEQVDPEEWHRILDRFFHILTDGVHRFEGTVNQYTGDGFLVAFDGPARAIRCAAAIVSAPRSLGMEVRAGLHRSECEVRTDDLAGIAVHIGARIAALAGAGEVLVTGSGIEFAHRGQHNRNGLSLSRDESTAVSSPRFATPCSV